MTSRSLFPRHTALTAALLCTALATTTAQSQAPAPPTTISACFVPSLGALYLIRLEGLPAACLSPAHQEITWSVGTSIEDGSITALKLADGTVTTVKVADGAITSAKVADNAITAEKLADAAITAAKIAEGAVTSAQLADGAVISAKLAEGAVTSVKIADGAINADKLAFQAASSEEIAALASSLASTGAVNAPDNPVDWSRIKNIPAAFADGIDNEGSAGELSDGAVTTAKLANGAVIGTKLSTALVMTDGVAFSGTLNSGSNPFDGLFGVRMAWFPGRAAIRAGAGGPEWSTANTGLYSAAFGSNVMASGAASFAAGAVVTASGTSAIALGNNVSATGIFSTALGRAASTNGFGGSFVWGDNSTGGSTNVNATAANQFVTRATGGYRLFSSMNTSSFTFEGGTGTGCALTNGALTCSGQIRAASGGVRFPDGSVQSTASGSCPAGTRRFAGNCFEVALRPAQAWTNAILACAGLDRRLGTAAELIGFTRQDGVPRSADELTSEVWFESSVAQFRGMGVQSNIGSSNLVYHSTVDVTREFRCVASPL